MYQKYLNYRNLWIACFALLGCSLVAKPGYYLLRQQLLDYSAKQFWSNFKSSDQTPQTGDPVAWLSAPEAGVNHPILWRVTEENLRKFPSWSQVSAGPNQKGLGVVFGHRDAHFRKLSGLVLGDTVLLEDLEGERPFKVNQLSIIPKEDLAEALTINKHFEQGLVLVTCYPFRYAGPAPQRFLVWLEPLELPEEPLQIVYGGSREKCVSE